MSQIGDKDIVHEVVDRLRSDSITGNYAFGVTSEDGVVTLRGSVSDQNARLRAVGIVRSTPGVKGVIDKLFRSQSSVGMSFSP